MTQNHPVLNNNGRPDRLLRDVEAAAMLGIGRSTFHRWVAAGEIPKPIKMCGVTRWWKTEIEARVARISEARGEAELEK